MLQLSHEANFYQLNNHGCVSNTRDSKKREAVEVELTTGLDLLPQQRAKLIRGSGWSKADALLSSVFLNL